MRKLLSLVPALLLALSGCAGLTPKAGAPFSEASAQPGRALVYVYRSDTVAGEWVPTVRVEGTPNFDLQNKTYAALNLAPGKHVVRADWPRRSDVGSAQATLDAQPNQTYYVKVAAETHDGAVGSAVVFYMSAKPTVTVVQRDEAMKVLPQAKSAL